MRTVRRRDTAAELAVRSAVHRRGLRFRIDVSPLPGLRSRADLVFPTHRVAVFVDGCFWHSCPSHATSPRANEGWWKEKLKQNRLRDRRVDAQLEEAGWRVIRVWEHEDPEEAADRIEGLIRSTTSAGITLV
jgi:DNA mismatch endonuclease (patch repair protein)